MKHPKWEDVDWHNTHLECASGSYHFGIIDRQDGRFVALAIGTGTNGTNIALLSDDDVDELARMLRHTAKSL